MSANNSYEAMMVFSVKNGEEGVPALIEKFKALIEQNGTLDSIDEWGKRKLAYAIDDEPEGFYALFNFSAAGVLPYRRYNRRRSPLTRCQKVRKQRCLTLQ